MIEISVNQVGGSTIGIVKIDEKDPKATPEVIQPLDGETLAVLIATLTRFQVAAEEARKAWV